MSFSLAEYRDLVDMLRDSGRVFMAMSDYMAEEPATPCILLRHDVDRFPRRAVALAHLESELGVVSTFYFRADRRGRFPAGHIAEIDHLGHEVGYHYECLSACHGDRDRAIEQFEENLDRFREIAPCRSVSMHGKPLSRFDNSELLRQVELTRFGLVGDATLFFTGRSPIYFTDTGGAWRGGVNFRDHVGTGNREAPALDDPGFPRWIGGQRELLYISTHPERWPASPAGRFQAAAQDRLLNLVKRIIEFSRWLS